MNGMVDYALRSELAAGIITSGRMLHLSFIVRIEFLS